MCKPLPLQALDKRSRFSRWKVTVFTVNVNPQGKSCDITFRVELRGIDVLFQAEHLDRAALSP